MFVSLDKDTDVKIVKSRTKHLYTFHFLSSTCSAKSHFVPPHLVCPTPVVPKVPAFGTLVMEVQGVFKGLLEKVLKGETLGDE